MCGWGSQNTAPLDDPKDLSIEKLPSPVDAAALPTLRQLQFRSAGERRSTKPPFRASSPVTRDTLHHPAETLPPAANAAMR